MNRAIIAILLTLPLAASSAVALTSVPGPIATARADVARAEAEEARLTRAASDARGEVARLTAERLSAAAGIAAAEARISEANATLAARDALVRSNADKLAKKQAPLAALVAGVVNLGRRPPLISLADEKGLDEMVRMRTLLDLAVPRIRAQTAALSAELAANRRLADDARAARRTQREARVELARRQQRFAVLEAKAVDRASSLDAGAVGAGDRTIVASEGVAALDNAADRARAARRLARELAAFPPAQRRPIAPDSRAAPPPLAFILPVDGPVTDGLGQISASGIRSRGTTFATSAGAPVLVPADGRLLFAGPFRSHDGIAVIDHGGGWLCLLVGVRAEATRGQRLSRGAMLGRALGPVTVECSIKGQMVSPADIAR